jgi:hypothetical protein
MDARPIPGMFDEALLHSVREEVFEPVAGTDPGPSCGRSSLGSLELSRLKATAAPHRVRGTEGNLPQRRNDMKKKTVAGEPNRAIKLSEITEQELDQVTGATSVNPLYTPLTSGGSNPLYESASAATNPLYTP